MGLVRGLLSREHRRWGADGLDLYRCTECGYVAFTRGGLHGHVESHRPWWKIWGVANIEYLEERTEVVELGPR